MIMAHYEDIFDDCGKVLCVLCQVVLSDDSFYIEAHINDENHRKLYLDRLLIRNSMEIRVNDVKCSVCNNDKIELQDSFEHINSPNHSHLIERIKRIVDKDGGFIELPDNVIENELNCLICNRQISFTLEDIEKHVSSLVHRRARAIAVQPFNGLVSVDGRDKDLWCKICKMYISNYIESIFEHVDNNEEHTTHLTKLLGLVKGQNIMIEKFLVNPKEDKALCKKCDKEVSCNLINLDSHIRGDLHRK